MKTLGKVVFVVILIVLITAFALKFSPVHSPCYRDANTVAQELRQDMVNNIEFFNIAATDSKLGEIKTCQRLEISLGNAPIITEEEENHWMRLSIFNELRHLKIPPSSTCSFEQLYYKYERLEAIEAALSKYKIKPEEVSTSTEQLAAIRRNLQVSEFRKKTDQMTELVPNSYWTRDFDETYQMVENFRKKNNLEWSDAFISPINIECLRGRFYAQEARNLYEKLRYFEADCCNLWDVEWTLLRKAKESLKKVGFCGFPVPTENELEEAARNIYARWAIKAIKDLRDGLYNFPRSMKVVDDIMEASQRGGFTLEQLGTSKKELAVLSGVNPLMEKLR